jgi:hypothetical protein
VKTLVDFGIMGWVKLLEGHSNWTNSKLTLDYVLQSKSCDNQIMFPFYPSQVVIKIDWYKNDALFQKSVCSDWKKNQGECRSHALLNKLKINVYLDKKLWPGDTHRLYVAHEFGHMLGLGDTYKQENYREPPMQMPSVMNLKSTDFTEDDRLGVRAAFEVSLGRKRSCGLSAVEVQAKVNLEGSLFCLENAKAVINHGPDRNDKTQ